ncbi:MAG: Maf family protein [Lachnospiraceae bacterium]
MYNWVLASASPRRKELLKMVIEQYDVIVSDCEEKYVSEKPDEIVKELAILKGQAVAERVAPGTIVVAADTIVWADEKVLGKPVDYNDAVAMLRLLSNNTHQVYTGVCVILKKEDGYETGTFAEETKLKVSPLTDREINDYLIKEEPYDKAGGYGIQGSFSKFVDSLTGDYNNVVGFPVHRFYEYIKQKGYVN